MDCMMKSQRRVPPLRDLCATSRHAGMHTTLRRWEGSIVGRKNEDAAACVDGVPVGCTAVNCDQELIAVLAGGHE